MSWMYVAIAVTFSCTLSGTTLAEEKNSQALMPLQAVSLDKSFIQSVYNKNWSNQLRQQYKQMLESDDIDRTHGYNSRAESRRYLETNARMANWTRTRILNERIPELLLQNLDHESGFVQFFRAIRKVLGSSSLGAIFERRRPEHLYQSESKAVDTSMMSQKEKIKYYNSLHPVRKKQEIETRLRAKWNLLKTRGNLRLQNAVLDTQFDVNFQANKNLPSHLGQEDMMTVRMKRNIELVNVDSQLNYGLTNKIVRVELSKQITEQIAADAFAARATAGMLHTGATTSDNAVRLRYNISF